MEPRAPGPGCAAARSSSGDWSTSPLPGDSCRASSTSAKPSTGPISSGRSRLIALLIGLPIVLVLAYYHGDRGQQRISTPEFAILTLLLLLGGGAFWYYQRASEAGRDAAPTASAVQPDASPGIKDARPSVAVLPFENRSREADDAFFVDGIHDDILTQLTKVGALKVIARTSVEQFRDTKLTIRRSARSSA